MKFSIDRFEGDFAVCIGESGERIQVLSSLLPQGAREGSVIEKIRRSYVLCAEEEQKLRSENHKKAQSLFDE